MDSRAARIDQWRDQLHALVRDTDAADNLLAFVLSSPEMRELYRTTVSVSPEMVIHAIKVLVGLGLTPQQTRDFIVGNPPSDERTLMHILTCYPGLFVFLSNAKARRRGGDALD